MEKVAVNNNDTKKEYIYNLVSVDPRLARKYNEVNKYCKIVKIDLDSTIYKEFKGGDLNRFLELIFRKALLVYFNKILEFKNINNEEDLYGTLYYLSFEYIKIVKKDENRKLYIDKEINDLKVLVEFFSTQALTKDSFKDFDFGNLSAKKIIAFLLNSTIKAYQAKGKKISKEESEANIVYSLINLYMTSELERVFLNEHLEDYNKYKNEKDSLNETIISLDQNIKENEHQTALLEVTIDTTDAKLEKFLNHNSLTRKIFYDKKIKDAEEKIESSEKKVDSLRNQNQNFRRKLKSSKSKLTKLEHEFKNSFETELKELNSYYETDLVINIEDFEDKNKLKKKSKTISKDILERLKTLGIKVEVTSFSLDDYVKLKKLVSDYKEKFSNKNVYHRKIVELLDQYGYYLKA